MSLGGLIGLLIAFAGLAVSILCIVVGTLRNARAPRPDEGPGATLLWAGHVAAITAFVALAFCCLLMVYCFVSGDTSIEYVVRGTSHQEGALGTFLRVAGLWEGREGSLLFWAWLIALFAFVMALRNMRKLERVDNMALVVMMAVLAAFVSIMLFSEDNSPFVAMDPKYLDANGGLVGAATAWGMNPLLEHWAMAVHPPALFVGYAGLTVPFAYAVATLITNNASDEWVRKSQRYAVVAWWFLGLGIGLGSVWAYVVLGWGGYWGWDAVENASLLPWLVGLALLHSMTVYRQRGAFKRWSIMCAALAFAFVITGTFISRSGLIESVHAFTGDPVSINLFGGMIIASVVVAAGGVITRWKSFAPANAADEELGSLFSRDAAYYFNNVIMVVFAFLVCYLTVSSALPSFLPFGGQVISAGTYDAVARPLGIFYCMVLALCPLLGWASTSREAFLKRAKVPAILAAIVFVLLMVYLVGVLWPSYDATIANGGTRAESLASMGPAWYYKGLSAVGFAVASLVIFNTLYMIGKRAAAWGKAHGASTAASLFKMIPGNASAVGGYLAHVGIGIILIGLIGSSMFVSERSGYVEYRATTDSAADFHMGDYTLRYTSNDIKDADRSVFYTVEFDVYQGEQFIAHVAPDVEMNKTTQQTKSNAAIVSFPLHDFFIVYKGVNSIGQFSIDVRVNPLINFVWAGFGLLLAGGAIAALGRRQAKQGGAQAASDPADDEAAPRENSSAAPEAASRAAEDALGDEAQLASKAESGDDASAG